METEKTPIISKLFLCNLCHFECSKKSEWLRHVDTQKHLRILKYADVAKKAPSHVYGCNKCNKTYKYHSGLWKHNNICKNNDVIVNTDIDNNINTVILEKKDIDLKYLLLEVIKINSELQKQNSELQKQLIDNCKNTNNTINNNNNNDNNNNDNNINSEDGEDKIIRPIAKEILIDKMQFIK